MENWDGPLKEASTDLNKSAGKITIISDLQTGALFEVMESFMEAFGSKDRLFLYEPFNYEPLRQANKRVFGNDSIPMYHIDKADYIISFAADFLESWISSVQFSYQFSQMHSYKDGKIGWMTYVGPRFSMTAANADEFFQLEPGTEYLAALAILREIIDKGWAKADVGNIKPLVENFKYSGLPNEKITQIADKFVHSNSSVALAGPVGAKGQAAENLAMAVALLNYAAGRIGQTVDFSQTHALGKTITNEQLKKVLEGLNKDDVLIINNVNLAYCVAGAAENIRKAGTRIYIGTMPDETSRLTPWIFPADSPLESWGDYQPWSGLHCLMQPTMARLYGTRSAGDIFLSLAKASGRPLKRKGSQEVNSFEEWLKLEWQELHSKIASDVPFEEFWKQSLQAGFAEEKPQKVEAKLSSDVSNIKFPEQQTEKSTHLWAWASVLLFDGRVSNRGWIQETAEPISGQVWGNIADIHPKKAQSLNLSNDDEIEIKTKAGQIRLPVRITEDVAENALAVSFGQGHTAFGNLAKYRGANVFDIIDSDSNSIFGNIEIKKTGKTAKPVFLRTNQQQHHRELMQWDELSAVAEMKPGEGDKLRLPLPEGYDRQKDLYPPIEYKKHRWAMVIDLTRCIGCGACTVACSSENNIAVVGEDSCRRWLEMAWLRIIPYRNEKNEKFLGFLPMLCQHCDMAPCEPVCPVFASVHNEEGLNAQIYNRCIGTRYCSNNCPYKVRRFNWQNIKWQKPLNLQLNPDVTVRERGVMEKCTFCIQRIKEAEITAKTQRRPVRDGEIQPACLQSCPTKVFTFGDLLDPNSQVSRLTRNDPRRYHVLEELNTKPAITYLRRIKNGRENV